MHNNVGIATNWRGEMSVQIGGQTVMTKLFGAQRASAEIHRYDTEKYQQQEKSKHLN